MKTNKIYTWLLGTTLGIVASAVIQSQDAPTAQEPKNNAATTQANTPEKTPAPPAVKDTGEKTDAKAAPARTASTGEKGLRLNFRDVPLDMVLEYLSEEAGFIIVKKVDVKGKVNVVSHQPVTKDEAVELLNTFLNDNEYAAVRNGRTLTIMTREEAKKKEIPIKKGVDPESIPKNDAMVTQIIPVKHANVTQLIQNLTPLLDSYATSSMTANESANSLILTATQNDIRRMTEIISALDESISNTSSIKVYPLNYADAKELATVIKELFAPTTQQQGGGRGQFFNQLGGGGGGLPGGLGALLGGGGGFGGGGGGRGGGGAGGNFGAGGNNGGGRGGRGGGAASAVNSRVVAVADERSNSLVVGAPEDMIAMIDDVVKKIDQPVDDISNCDPAFRLNNTCGFGQTPGVYRITVRGAGFQTRQIAARFAAKSGQDCCTCLPVEDVTAVLVPE